jgi:hypothetical protein
MSRPSTAAWRGNRSAPTARATVRPIFVAALNLAAVGRDQSRGFAPPTQRNHPMKIALLVVLGLLLGALGGAALGIGAGLIWVEIFKTTSFEGYSGMLVFFTFMPLAVIAIRDAEIAIEREPARRHDR